MRSLFIPLATGLLLVGCSEGVVGPCAGQDCPTLIGCETDGGVVCGPLQVCQERVCNGVGWICGKDALGNFAWLRKLAPCDDNNPCTRDDICVAGQCVGTPLPCTTPPPNICQDNVTLKTYMSKGTCKQGICSYSSAQIKCSGQCVAGQCAGSPCAGITCNNPPGPCYQDPGKCVEGKCTYAPKTAGSGCKHTDKCVVSAICDGQGKCKGSTLSCSRPHTTGGTCVAGVCQGYKCDKDWGNCNGTWNDGCERPLNTASNCGKCNSVCVSAANAKPYCAGSVCKLSCTSPYKDCDGKYSNGCEIPQGVANRCNKSGLTSGGSNPTGCGTPYCGSSSTTHAANFGTWTCTFCSHCHHFSNGYAWCLYGSGSSGNYSKDRCTSCCNASLADKVCSK